MKGFAPNALILLPDFKDYQEAYGGYKEQLQTALNNLLAYLGSVDMEPTFLSTDPLAGHLFAEREGVAWLATDNPGGMYFIQKNLQVPTFPSLIPLRTEFLEELDKKFPVERGCTVQQRCYTESQRVNRAEKLLIASYKVVFLFGNQYSLRPKPEDGRALFFVNTQLIPKLKLSGFDANINAFLGFDNANMSLTGWRFKDG